MKEYWNKLTSGQKAKLIFKIVAGILALLFAILNWQSVSISLVFFKMNVSLTVLILICLGIGYASASIFDFRKDKNKEPK